LLTAAALLVLAVTLVWRATLPWLLGAFAAIALRAAWEWATLCPALAGARRGWLLAALALALAGLYALPADFTAPLLGAALVWWAVAFGLVLRYPALPGWMGQPLPQGVVIVLALGGAWLALAYLADGQRPLLLLCLALVWAADSAAYMVGRRIGKRRLCPQVSPGKTVEGLVGGLAGAALTGLVAGALWRLEGGAIAALVALTTICAGVSVIGDLTESLFKRRAGAKDSSHLLPGHGGVLDRIDALIAAAPLFALTAPLLVRV
jgi:phosphatidate cytidylyltransferase